MHLPQFIGENLLQNIMLPHMSHCSALVPLCSHRSPKFRMLTRVHIYKIALNKELLYESLKLIWINAKLLILYPIYARDITLYNNVRVFSKENLT